MPCPVRNAILGAIVLIALLAGCPSENHPPFQLQITPADIDDAIPGQACVFLVTVTDRPLTPGISGPVELSVSGSGAGNGRKWRPGQGRSSGDNGYT